MSKKVKCILLMVLVLFVAAAEVISYKYIRKNEGQYIDEVNAIATEKNLPKLSMRYDFVESFNQKKYDFMQREICQGDNNKPSLLFLGGSYMYGDGLEQEETLPYLVYKMTNMSAVNRGFGGGSIINSLITLTDKNLYKLYDNNDDDKSKSEFYKLFKNKKISKPKYVFYEYQNDDKMRINSLYKVFFVTGRNRYEIMPTFEYKNGNLKIKKFPKIFYPLLMTYTAKAISLNYLYSANQSVKTEDKMVELLTAVKDLTEKNFEGSKLIVIVYKDSNGESIPDDLWNKLEEKGVILVNAEDLAGHELTSDKWKHQNVPNEQANKDVAKGLVKALKL